MVCYSSYHHLLSHLVVFELVLLRLRALMSNITKFIIEAIHLGDALLLATCEELFFLS